ncbi:MAG: hypothetical protein ACE5D6_08665, partial [Candidatus Zixiibacteriota bacterium]
MIPVCINFNTSPYYFFEIIGAGVKVDTNWYQIFYNPSFEIDTNILQFSLIWIANDNAEINIKDGKLRKKTVDITYADTNIYALPNDFFELIEAEAKTDSDWYSTMYNPAFLIDTNILQYTLNQRDGTSDIIIKDGKLLKKTIDIIYYDTANVGYSLPSDFFELIGASIITDKNSYRVMHNPQFNIDTDLFQYDLNWIANDNAEINIKDGKLRK